MGDKAGPFDFLNRTLLITYENCIPWGESSLQDHFPWGKQIKFTTPTYMIPIRGTVEKYAPSKPPPACKYYSRLPVLICLTVRFHCFTASLRCSAEEGNTQRSNSKAPPHVAIVSCFFLQKVRKCNKCNIDGESPQYGTLYGVEAKLPSKWILFQKETFPNGIPQTISSYTPWRVPKWEQTPRVNLYAEGIKPRCAFSPGATHIGTAHFCGTVHPLQISSGII